jgi:BolA protein
MSENSPVETTMYHKLVSRFSPSELQITNDSAKHAGHAEAGDGHETHFTIIIVSYAFVDIPRIQRHRMIYELLKEEFDQGLHAVAIKAYTPQEAENRNI